jgi:ribose transport system substrate-binding protein
MRFARLFLFVVFVCALFACDKSTNPTAASGAASVSPRAPFPSKQFVVALVLKTQTNPFFIAMEKGARRAEKEYGIKLVTRGGSQETYIQEQIQIVEDVIESKVDAIVIAPSDSAMLVPIVKKAQDAGIVVVNIDNSLDQMAMQNLHMKPIPFISVDNEMASYQVVKSVIANLNKPTQAAIIEGMPGAENGRLRVEGAKRAFKENSSIKIVGDETAHWKIDEAHEVTKKLFTIHPNIHVLFCANDMMALGAVQYIAESGLKNVQVIGYDALDEAKQAIKVGTLAATLDQQADEQGYQGVVFAVRALKGERLPEILLVNTKIVDAASLK